VTILVILTSRTTGEMANGVVLKLFRPRLQFVFVTRTIFQYETGGQTHAQSHDHSIYSDSMASRGKNRRRKHLNAKSKDSMKLIKIE